MSIQTIPTTAQAWRFPADQTAWDSYRSLTLKDVPVPSPGKGEVLVKLRAVSLNQRDLMISNGTYPLPVTTGQDQQGLIPTTDGAGDIVAVGQDVTEWRVGDRVHSLFSEGWVDGPVKPELFATVLGGGVQGCLTQYRIFQAQFVLPIPPHLSYEQAATIACAGATSWDALFGSRHITQDSTVLVLGSGGVSIFAAQLAKAIGARVIATTSSQAKEEKYRALGVDDVINYRQNPEWSAKVKELTNGQGADDVIEIGGSGTLIHSIKSVKQQGSVHLIGFLAQPEEGKAATLNEVAQMIMFTQASLRGVVVGGKVAVQAFDAFLVKHNIVPVVDAQVFEWKEAVEAFAYLESGAHFGKVVIRVD